MATKNSVPKPCKGQQVDSTGGEGSKHPYGFRKLLDDIKAQVPIAAVADDLGAGLKPNGKGLRGRGIDHGGDNPTSLLIQTEEQRYWCFRCNEGGDVLDLWMKAKGIPDAMDGIMDLAGTYGVEPTSRPNFGRRQARQKPVRDAMEQARINSVHRRLYRIFVRNTISLIEDEEERRHEARAIWDELEPIARMVVARGGWA